MRELIPRVIAATPFFLAELASAAILAPGSVEPLTDALAEYRANLAISEQNPLRPYKPTPGIQGRIALEEMHAQGIPATPLSATLALGLSRTVD